MGMFSKILGGIFGKKKEEEQEAAEAAAAEAPVVVDAVEQSTAEAPPAAAPAPEPAEPVDVDAVLTAKAAAKGEDLDWKVSIVDLLKVLDLDSSYGARKELAAEMGISGYSGTAEQNIEMHKLVIQKIAANGGTVPAELLD